MRNYYVAHMLSKFVCLILLASLCKGSEFEYSEFTYQNFPDDLDNLSRNLNLDGTATVNYEGVLFLTSGREQRYGHAFHANPLQFKSLPNGTAFSFSTTFVFAMLSHYQGLSGHGFAFVIAPSSSLDGVIANHYLGLFNETNIGKASNHVLAVEFDTIISSEFGDINDNHVGIDINDLRSVISAPARYYTSASDYKDLSLASGHLMQVWIDYDGVEKLLNVTICPTHVTKPKKPLLSLRRDISPLLLDNMYVGFSSATGSVPTIHCILGWSFKMNGHAQEINLSSLPKLPKLYKLKPEKSTILKIALPVAFSIFFLSIVLGTFLVMRLKNRYAEVLEDWEQKYGPHRFSYKDLYIATKGFKDKEFLGKGGFGRVYRGVIPGSRMHVAVKRITDESRQGIKEFVAEIVTLGQLRHRNLVQLLGYCRRKGELLLVYDYMPNGSLDKLLFGPSESRLTWRQRFGIIKGVASGLVYLHEEWDQVVIHRDIKASNVLVDVDFTGKLSDFGLARLYDHGTNPQTTHAAGTFGYLAPELARSGKATVATDAYSFGAFVLEVACGRRPIQVLESNGNIILVDWVIKSWRKGEILVTADPKLGGEYVKEEMELVLKLGLLCSQTKSSARPTMRQVLQFLENEFSLHDLSHECLAFGDDEESSDFPLEITDSTLTSVADSLLSSGR